MNRLKLTLVAAGGIALAAMSVSFASASPVWPNGIATDRGAVTEARLVCDASGRCWQTRPRWEAAPVYGYVGPVRRRGWYPGKGLCAAGRWEYCR